MSTIAGRLQLSCDALAASCLQSPISRLCLPEEPPLKLVVQLSFLLPSVSGAIARGDQFKMHGIHQGMPIPGLVCPLGAHVTGLDRGCAWYTRSYEGGTINAQHSFRRATSIGRRQTAVPCCIYPEGPNPSPLSAPYPPQLGLTGLCSYRSQFNGQYDLQGTAYGSRSTGMPRKLPLPLPRPGMASHHGAWCRLCGC